MVRRSETEEISLWTISVGIVSCANGGIYSSPYATSWTHLHPQGLSNDLQCVRWLNSIANWGGRVDHKDCRSRQQNVHGKGHQGQL